VPHTIASASPLQPSSHEPLYVQLAHRLADDITSGRLGPGDKVPTEAELMAAHGLSRVTVRQAMQLLARNGQVVSHRGKGSFVTRTALQQDLSTLQGFQEALRSQGVEPQTELLEFSASAGRVDRQRPAGLDLPVRLRRRYCVDGEPFAVVEAYLPADVAQLGEARAAQLAVYDILQQFMGLRIGRADVAIQCARPSAKVSKELALEPRSHVLVMHRTSYTVAGRPCEHMRIHIVPERYSFRLSLPGPIEIASALQPAATSTSLAVASPDRTPKPTRRRTHE
jgi:GntR family transcriptional regulator